MSKATNKMDPNVKNKNTRSAGRFITRREAVDAKKRLRTTPSGVRYVVRFSLGQRVEHLILTLSFTMLGVTGLSQTYYESELGNFFLALFGGIDAIRQIHHVFAFLFGAQSIYHVGLYVYNLFVYRQIGKMLPDWNDVKTFFQMMKLNLGFSHEHPRFDRYTFEEKMEYWALVWGTVIMGASGLIQWFPVLTTEYLPGWVVPVARALHRWEAVLAVLAILTWHMYHAVLKKLNTSIFTGRISIEDMEEEHPLELLYLERASAVVNNTKWPVFIKLQDNENKQNGDKRSPVKKGEKAKVSKKSKEAKTGMVADGGKQ